MQFTYCDGMQFNLSNTYFSDVFVMLSCVKIHVIISKVIVTSIPIDVKIMDLLFFTQPIEQHIPQFFLLLSDIKLTVPLSVFSGVAGCVCPI